MPRTSVQDGYFDAPLAGFPGQLADFGTSLDYSVRGYPAEGAVIGGRGAVRGTDIDIDPDANPLNQPAPFTIKAPDGATVAADFVGIVVRTESMTNVNDEAAYANETMASATFRRAKGALVYVKNSVAVAAGDDVYMSIDEAQVPNLPVGEFTNATGAGVIQIPDLQWFKQAAAGGVAIIEQL